VRELVLSTNDVSGQRLVKHPVGLRRQRLHLRATNSVESTFVTVSLRVEATKLPGSRVARMAMAYKLVEAAQARWLTVNAPHLVAIVRAGAIFHKGNCSNAPSTSPPEPDESTETEVA